MEIKMIKDLLIQRKDSDRIAIESVDQSITYREWYQASKHLSYIIRELCEEGTQNVIVCLPNSIDYAVAYFGVLFSGNVIVPIAPEATVTEMQRLVEYCEAKLIISNSCYIDRFSEMYCHKKLTGISIEEAYSEDSDDLTEIPLNGEENDLCIMLHTSGTTSNPKRVMLSNKNLLVNIKAHTSVMMLDENDVSLITLPMFFGYCNTSQFLSHLYVGGKIVISHAVFHPAVFWSTVCKYGITNVTVVPSMLMNIYKAGRSALPKNQTHTLRYICYGGGRSNPEVIEKLIRAFPEVGFVHTYGQTECSPRVTALMPQDAIRKSGSVGTPLPGVEIAIFSPNGEKLDADLSGEICVKGDNVMLGYYKNPNLTEETIRNGWLHTGDEGYIDKDGFLYLCGRLKSMIIYNGINLYPEEIEEILVAADMIEDAIVYGVENNICGEVPVADIVVNANYNEQKLREYCSKHLSKYKIPKLFRCVEKIEKTYNKKNKRYRTKLNEKAGE